MTDNIAKIFNCLVTEIEMSPDKSMTRITLDNYHEFEGSENTDGALKIAVPLPSKDLEKIQKGDTAKVKLIGSANISECGMVLEFSRNNRPIKSFQLK